MDHDLSALWVEGDLSYLEIASLRSALDLGYHVTLYHYGPVGGVPDGVTMADAETILPRGDLLVYDNGSYALGANLFRYKLLQARPTTWVDLDLMFLRRMPETSYLFGWQDDTRQANNAVLRAPQDSSLLQDLIAFFDMDPPVVPWWTRQQAERHAQLRAQGKSKPLSALPWGTSGPKLLTHLVHKLGLADKAQPIDRFYPVGWRDADVVFGDHTVVDAVITDQTCAVHLWGSQIKQHRTVRPSAHSWIARFCGQRGYAMPE